MEFPNNLYLAFSVKFFGKTKFSLKHKNFKISFGVKYLI